MNFHVFGGMSKYAWDDDPKHIAFTLARYKHTAKMLAGYSNVIEIGCADGFGTRIVRQHVKGGLTAIDKDTDSIAEARKGASEKWQITFSTGDMLDGPWAGFDAAYLLDVLEHIDPKDEHRFLRNLCHTAPVAVIGTPSLESQDYASSHSKSGHVNCKTGEELKVTLRHYYRYVFLFSMNDETLHTGFLPMSHYFLALCCEPLHARLLRL